MFGKGHEVEEMKNRSDEMLSDRSLVVLDEVDFLRDYDIL